MPSLSLDGRNLLKLVLGIGGGITLLRFISSRFFRKALQDGSKKSSAAAIGSGGVAINRRSIQLAPEEGVWIYFGSQSGTAEAFSDELKEEAGRHGLQAKVVDLEEFEPSLIKKHKLLIMVVASYGDGGPTDNAIEFHKWMKDDRHGGDTMEGVKYTIFGLGNRQYVHFNRASKHCEQHLNRLGAKCIYPRGEGDDNKKIEDDFERWKENLWPAVIAALDGGDGAHVAVPDAESTNLTREQVLAGIRIEAVLSSPGEDAQFVDHLVQVGGMDVLGKWYFRAHQAPVVVARELRQKPDAKGGLTTKHIEVDVSELPDLQWSTADNLEVLPENPASEVQWFAERLGLAAADMEKNISFIRAPGIEFAQPMPFPTPCTVRTALSLYCDLVAMPDRRTMRQFAALIVDNEQQRAAAVALVEDKEAYRWLRSSPDSNRMRFRELFALFFSSANVDLSTFLQLCPRQKSRPYTIASSARENPKRIGICLSMVTERLKSISSVVAELAKRGHEVPKLQSQLDGLRLKDGKANEKLDFDAERRFEGVCSTMLCTRTEVGDKLWISVKASHFRLPKGSAAPIVMIGAGTGIAPFRAFLHEFKAEGGVRKKTILFFGCCSSTQDFIYKNELEEAMSSSPRALSELITAFSREKDHKIYVQHRIKEKAEMIKTLAKNGAYFYVCGSVAMGDAVKYEVGEALKSADALKRLEQEERFVTELW